MWLFQFSFKSTCALFLCRRICAWNRYAEFSVEFSEHVFCLLDFGWNWASQLHTSHAHIYDQVQKKRTWKLAQYPKKMCVFLHCKKEKTSRSDCITLNWSGKVHRVTRAKKQDFLRFTNMSRQRQSVYIFFWWARFTLNIILFGIVHFFEHFLLSISTWFFFINCFIYAHTESEFIFLYHMRRVYFVRPFDRTLTTLFIGVWLFQFWAPYV